MYARNCFDSYNKMIIIKNNAITFDDFCFQKDKINYIFYETLAEKIRL